MPALIDFKRLKEVVPLGTVLHLCQWTPNRIFGPYHMRGRCPLCTKGANAFHRTGNAWYCHACRRGGDQIELWTQFTGLHTYDAAIDLCRNLSVQIPWAR